MPLFQVFRCGLLHRAFMFQVKIETFNVGYGCWVYCSPKIPIWGFVYNFNIRSPKRGKHFVEVFHMLFSPYFANYKCAATRPAVALALRLAQATTKSQITSATSSFIFSSRKIPPSAG